MAEHTPGRLSISGFDTTTLIVIHEGPDRDGHTYRDGRHQYTMFRPGDIPDIYERAANAGRAKACWNACDDIPTASLEEGVVADMREALARSIQYIQLAIHDGIASGLDERTINIARADLEKANAALSKAQGEG